MEKPKEKALTTGNMMKLTCRAASKFWARHPALATLLIDDSGQDLLEYVLIGSLISLCAIVMLQNIASKVMSLYTAIQTTFSGAI